MNIASTLIAKVNSNATIAATRIQAEEYLTMAQSTLRAKREENTIRVSKLAQKNLLTLAKGADKFSQTLVELSDKLEPVSKPIIIKPARKVGAKKPVVKAALKATSATSTTSTKAVKKVKAVVVESTEPAAA
jgi:hypothetical protein